MSYIAVDDVDARVKKAQSLGATLMRPIFDVPGVGRIADPERAGRRRHRLDDAGFSVKSQELTMQHKVVSQDEWLAARKALLAKEKEFTKARDPLSAARRALPWVKVDKTYVFDGPERQADARRSVRRPQPAHRLSLHVRPGLGRRLSALLALGR